MILEQALKLFETVRKSPNREKVREVVNRLKPETRGIGNKIYPAPVLGMLLGEQDKFKAFFGISPNEEFSSWDEADRRFLYGIHNQIVKLNRLCTNPLEEIPDALFAVKPLPYKYYYSDENEFENLLFSEEDAKEMAQAFANHPSFGITLSDSSIATNIRLQTQSREIVSQYLSNLTESGVGKNALWVTKLKELEEANHPNYKVQKYLAALVALNNSLSNINQLIYQAIFQDEIYHISRKDIVDYLITTTQSGLGMSVNYLPNGLLITITPTDLVFISVSSDFENRLCCIYDQSLTLEFNYPSKINMRVLDENMCSYGWLIK